MKDKIDYVYNSSYRALLLAGVAISIMLCTFIFCRAEDESPDCHFDRIAAINHPRLILPTSREADLKILLEKDSAMMFLHRYILMKSKALMDKPALEYQKKGRRLWEVSHEALSRVLFLSYAYRTQNDSLAAHRAIKEILNVCSFRDWNETHFLDVAEMTMAVAIGYDWLYDLLDNSQRVLISKAIKEKAFDHVLKGRGPDYLRSSSNWNSVCNAGMLYGAIAVYDIMPDLATKVIKSVINSNPRVLESYNPDGGYPEGYSYWGYGTSFQVLLMDALESLLCYEFENKDGFLKTGKFIDFMVSPLGKSFNFSDCSEVATCHFPMWWFAWKTGDETLTYTSEKFIDNKKYNFLENSLLPLIPIFAARLNNRNTHKPVEKTLVIQGKTPVFIYREGWDSTTDNYLGIKGGSAKTTHAHSDAGSFVYDFEGVRWAMDLGRQDYYSLEKEGIDLWNMHQDSQRWDIMRMRNDCHNTLTIDSLRHNVNAFAEILQTFRLEDKKGAIVDLTSTLGKIKKAHRSIYLDDSDYLHVIDSITTGEDDIQLTWIMVTPAEAEIISPHIIRLVKDGITMDLTIESNKVLEIQPHIWTNHPMHYYDAPNPGTQRVGFSTNIKRRNDVSIVTMLRRSE